MEIAELSDNQAESGVVSTLVYHPEYILHSEFLKAGHFFNKDNGCIYWAISELYKAGIDNIDAFNISNMLSSNTAVKNTIAKYNLPTINEYIDLCSETARHSLEEYLLLAKKVTELAFKRDLHKVLNTIDSNCFDKSKNLDELNKITYDNLNGLTERYIGTNDIKPFGETTDQLWEEICERRTEDGIYGIPSKYKCLNEYFTYEPGELVVVQAKYKQGKSVILLNELVHFLKCGVPTLLVDTEMGDRLYMERILAHLSGVDVKRIKNGCYSEEEAAKIEDSKKWLKKQPFVRIYKPDMTMDELYSLCKILKYKMGLQMVIYDYIKSNETDSSQQYNALGSLTDFLKNRIAGELNLAVLSACQLNRQGEVADSMKINRYLSVGIKWFFKTQEQIVKYGMNCGNAGLKIEVNRLGEQMPSDDEEAFLDFYFDGNKMSITEAEQHDTDLSEFD